MSVDVIPEAGSVLDPAEQQLVDSAIAALLADADPRTLDPIEFRRRRYDHGLAWVYFDRGFGGLGASPKAQGYVERRLRAAGAGPMDSAMFFMNLAGPTIHTHGTDEQKRRFLRPMFSGEEKWCQLFSEPGAGSDFAGLATRAVRDGDEWVVNGQKVWNTLAHLGDWGMLVTRTDPEQPKHKGMTYFAVDMRSPGVDVRPLRQMTGEAEFNEVYLTDVRVPDANRIGGTGEGWRVSLTTLMNERVSIGGGSGAVPPRGSGPIGEIVALWIELPPEERTSTRLDRFMSLWARAETLRLTNIRAGQARQVGNPGPEGSTSKLALAELNKAIYEFGMDLLGANGLVGFDYTFRRPDTLNDDTWGDPRHAFLRVRANSIEGGTSEILRNILGEQVLGLPGEPRVDKDLAWTKVPRN
jgi:alkylation response protein AidB-like acyl-CoA dehydrogenase